MVKWNAATKVLAGVNLYSDKSDSRLEKFAPHWYAHHFVRLDQAVLDGFLETHAGAFLVLQSADIKGECTSLLLHFREHGTRVLGFQLVRYRRISLENGGARFLETRLEQSYQGQRLIYDVNFSCTFPSSPDDTRISIP